MEILISIYLIVAGVIYSGHKEGIIKDDNKIKTYQFELEAAKKSGDKPLIEFIEARLKKFESEQK